MSERDDLVEYLRICGACHGCGIGADGDTCANCGDQRQPNRLAASLLERDGAELERLRAEVERVTERLHRREADLLAQMNTNIEVGNLYDAALARAEAAEKDAARYQWLRDCCNEDAVVQMQDWNEDGPTETYYEKRGAGLDAAIDAAIAEWRDTPVPVPPGECPYPIHADRSIEACVAAGDCGCGQNKT